MPIDKGTSKPITQLSGLQINYKDKYSCFNPPIVTTAERDALVNTDDPKNPIKDGTIVYNSDEKSVQAYQNGEWVNVGGSDPVPNVVTSANDGVEDNLVVYAGNDRTVKDSGVIINELKTPKTKKNGINATPLYQLSNLGALQFGSNENTADTGVILVDGLTPVTFQTQGTGADSRVCTVINGELGKGSSSPSALLEINSTEGGLLHARMTTTERDALLDPKDGLEIYNTDTKNLNIRKNGAWVEIGNVVGPSSAVNNNIPVFDGTSGTLIKDSGFSPSSFTAGGFKNLIYYTKENPPTSIKVKVSDIIGNADCAKLTLIGSGGNGGKSSSERQNNFAGCGGGGGATLIVYLRNLSLKEYWFYFVVYYTGGTPMGYTYVGINQTSLITTDQTIFSVNRGEDGNDGHIGNYQGGAGGSFDVTENRWYDKSNYSYIGIPGSRGNVGFRSWTDSSSSLPVGGSGGNSFFGQGGGSTLGTNGIDGSFYGGGGSGGAGLGTPGGSGGNSGLIMLEW